MDTTSSTGATGRARGPRGLARRTRSLIASGLLGGTHAAGERARTEGVRALKPPTVAGHLVPPCRAGSAGPGDSSRAWAPPPIAGPSSCCRQHGEWRDVPVRWGDDDEAAGCASLAGCPSSRARYVYRVSGQWPRRTSLVAGRRRVIAVRSLQATESAEADGRQVEPAQCLEVVADPGRVLVGRAGSAAATRACSRSCACCEVAGEGGLGAAVACVRVRSAARRRRSAAATSRSGGSTGAVAVAPRPGGRVEAVVGRAASSRGRRPGRPPRRCSGRPPRR